MKKIISLVFVFMLAVSLFAISSDEVIQNAANELGVPFDNLKAFVNAFYPEEEPAYGVLEIDIRDYKQDYKNNELLADKKYEGKTLRMTVTFDKIDSGWHTEYEMEVKESPYGSPALQILGEYNDILATLKPGQRVIVEGVGSGYSSWIDSCRIIQVLD